MVSAKSSAPRPQGEGVAASLSPRHETVLIAGADWARIAELSEIVELNGWIPLQAVSVDDALQLFRAAPPDLVVIAMRNTSATELEIVDRLRAEPGGDRVAIVCNIARDDTQFVIEAFRREADDVVVGRPDNDELSARLRARIVRTPLPRQNLIKDPITGALTPVAFRQQLKREIEAVSRGDKQGALGYVALEELPGIEAELGSRARDEIIAQVVRLIEHDGRTLDFVGFAGGVMSLLLPHTNRSGAQLRFDRLVKVIYRHGFTLGGKPIRLTPIIGYTESVRDVTSETLAERAWAAMAFSAEQRDLHPTRWTSAMSIEAADPSSVMRFLGRIRTSLQVVLQQTLLLVAPLAGYLWLDKVGLDFTHVLYYVILGALLLTTIAIVAESRAATKRPALPVAPGEPPPPASAVIAAYLPNEADTILETIESFLAQDYPNLQIILAYNTPQDLDVEREIEAIAAREPRFEALRVEGSVSKAQNVNAALSQVRGEFVGLFDADHHPAPGSFMRAWQWIASGVGVVQGHCVIRNGDANFLTKLVAVEFEIIYAVSHPGRARLHGFGIFGGSNGYWRTSLLHRTRMRGFMLTEDIDSSMRVLKAGEEIVSDPDLVSTELAPDSATALWNQRLRWAQGWSQVSLRHLATIVRGAPNTRQRLGLAYLLGWREIYPWVSLQMIPLLVFWWLRGEAIDWFIPLFVITSIITFAAGPMQVWFGWRLAHESIGRERRWFWLFLASSLTFYAEMKNVVARTAHIKELMKDRQWKVTPRSVPATLDAYAVGSADPAPADGAPSPWSKPDWAHPIGSEAEADERAKQSAPHNRRSDDARTADFEAE